MSQDNQSYITKVSYYSDQVYYGIINNPTTAKVITAGALILLAAGVPVMQAEISLKLVASGVAISTFATIAAVETSTDSSIKEPFGMAAIAEVVGGSISALGISATSCFVYSVAGGYFVGLPFIGAITGVVGYKMGKMIVRGAEKLTYKIYEYTDALLNSFVYGDSDNNLDEYDHSSADQELCLISGDINNVFSDALCVDEG